MLLETSHWQETSVAEKYRKINSSGEGTDNSVNKHYYHDPFFRSLLYNIHDSDILDVGAGDLELAFYISLAANSVTALDFPEMFTSQKSDFIRLISGKAEQLPFKDHSFDLVYSSLVLHWIKDYQQFLKEQFRVLRPGGRIVFSIVHPYVFKRGDFTQDNDGIYKFQPNDSMNAFDSIDSEEVTLSGTIGPLFHYPRHPYQYLESLDTQGFQLVKSYAPQPYVTKVNEDYIYVLISDGNYQVERHCMVKADEKWDSLNHLQKHMHSKPLFLFFEGSKL